MNARPTRRSVLKAGAVLAATISLSTRPSFGQAIERKPLPVKQIAEGVYAFRGQTGLMTQSNLGEICNVGFIVGNDCVAVVDSGGSVAEGKALIEAIRGVTDKPIRFLINTHMHPDHIFGNAAFSDAGVTIVGHHNLPRALHSRGDYYLSSYRDAMGPDLMAGIRIVSPGKTIDDVEEIDLGGRKLILKAWKPAHTDNDLTVFDPKSRTLFTGDLCFIDHLPTLDGSILGWIGQLPALAAIDARLAIPGHGPTPADWPEALKPQQHYFDALVGDLRTAIAAGTPLADAVQTAAENERKNWQLFHEYNIRNATAAFAELEWE